VSRTLILLITLFFAAQSFAEDVVIEAASSLEPGSQSTEVKKEPLTEVLDSFSGVNFVNLSSAPTPRDVIFLRGFTPERFYAYYGEVPLNGSGIRGNYYFDLSALPSLVKKVKVIYGPSAIYGSNPGGNIILEPAGFPLKKSFTFKASAGSYNTYGSSLSFSLPAGLTGLNFSAGGRSSKGYLRNDSFKGGSVELELFRFIGDSSVLKFYTFLSRVRDGLPVLNTPKVKASNYDDNYPEVDVTYFSLACAPYCKLKLIERGDDNYIVRQVERYAVSLMSQPGEGEVDLTLYFNRARKWENYYGFFRTPSGVKLTSMSFKGTDDFTYGVRALYTYGSLKVGSEFNSSGYGRIEKNGKDFVDSNLHALKRGALFGEVEKEFLRLKVKGGLRLEKWLGRGADGGTELLPALSLFKDFGKSTFYVGVGRVYRPPKAEELLWYSKEKPFLKAKGYDYDLKAEKGWDFEAGFKTPHFSIRLFNYYIKDYIISNFIAAQELLSLPFPNRVVENLDWVRNRGVELSYSGSYGLYDYSLSYTYQSFSHASSNFTPSQTPSPQVLVPRNKVVLSLGRRELLSSGDRATLKVKAYSRRKGLTEEVPGFAVFSLSYALKPLKDFELSFKIDNLFNKKYYFVEGYRMPGRTFAVNLTYSFGER